MSPAPPSTGAGGTAADADARVFDGPDDLDGSAREAVERLLFRLADDEFVQAERYTEWQVRAPTLESDLALSNIAQDELGHARLYYDLIEDVGYAEAELVYERPPEEWRHASLVELPYGEGDWADAIVRSYLYDVAEAVRLEAVADSAYRPLRERVPKIEGEEDYHREHAQNWLERLAGDEAGHDRLQSAVDRLFPYALTLFEPTDEGPDAVERRIDALGLRTMTLPEMGQQWLGTVVPFLESLGLAVPLDDGAVTDEMLPAAVGRDGEHTDAWFELHEEFTHTYREFGRTEATKLMADPDDAGGRR